MNKQYKHYTNITKEILDTIKVGDLIKVNDWTSPMKVKAVSENFFVMTQKDSGESYYSVCSKLPWNGADHNLMTGGMYHCGPDDWIFGTTLMFEYEDIYEFDNEEYNQKYLQEFEDGKVHISERGGLPIYDLYIKSESNKANSKYISHLTKI